MKTTFPRVNFIHEWKRFLYGLGIFVNICKWKCILMCDCIFVDKGLAEWQCLLYQACVERNQILLVFQRKILREHVINWHKIYIFPSYIVGYHIPTSFRLNSGTGVLNSQWNWWWEVHWNIYLFYKSWSFCVLLKSIMWMDRAIPMTVDTGRITKEMGTTAHPQTVVPPNLKLTSWEGKLYFFFLSIQPSVNIFFSTHYSR